MDLYVVLESPRLVTGGADVAAMSGAGAIALNNLNGQILGLRTEMRDEIGKLSERMTRIETLIETPLVPASGPRDPAGS